MGEVLGDKGAGSVRRDDDGRDFVVHGNLADLADLGALDGQHRHAFSGAVGHQCQGAGPVDRQARWQAAHLDRLDQRRRPGREVDHVQGIVGYRGEASVLRLIYQVAGDQAEPAVRRDLQVGWRPGHGVGERQSAGELRVGRVRNVEDRDGVAAGRAIAGSAGLEEQLAVQAHQQVRRVRLRGGGQQGKRQHGHL